jgi:hypothetical protein
VDKSNVDDEPMGYAPWSRFGKAFKFWSNNVLSIRQAKNGFIVRDADGEHVFMEWTDILIYMQKMPPPKLEDEPVEGF